MQYALDRKQFGKELIQFPRVAKACYDGRRNNGCPSAGIFQRL